MASYNVRALGIYNEYLDYISDTILVEDGVIKRFGSASYAKDVYVDGHVVPAFVDAHLHITWLGLALNGVDLSGVRSPEDLARKLSLAPAGIAYGRGWDQERFEERGTLPTRKLLDRYIPDKPAIAVRVCGHLAVLNTMALELTRIYEVFPDLVDKETGIVREDAVYRAVESILGKIDVTKIVKDAVMEIKRHGVAGVSSMSCPVSEAQALARLDSVGELVIRVACYPRKQHLAEALEALGDARNAAVVGVKDFADGSLGARTAYLSEEYNDEPGNRGLLLLTKRDIMRLADGVVNRGFKLAIHAIGDAALSEVIEAYQEIGIGGDGRIEHASVAPPSLIRELAGLGSHVVVQPRFKVSDWWIEDRLGKERVRWAYPFKTMVDAGVRIAFSTDSPVETINPIETIMAAESRCSQPTCRAEEALTRRESIYYYTRASALASGGPVAELGTIQSGKPAMLIWFDEDPKTARKLGIPKWVKVASSLPG